MHTIKRRLRYRSTQRGCRGHRRCCRRRSRCGGLGHRRHRRARRTLGGRPGAGRGLRRRHGVVGRLDVGAGQPPRPRRRRGRGRRAVPHLPARRARRALRRRAGRRVPRRGAGHGRLLPRAHRAEVRARRHDLRRLRRPPRRGHRPPLGRARARRRPRARRRRAQPAAPPALRDLVPRHGRDGRAGPDGVPLGVAGQPARPAARHPAGHPPPLRPRHPPTRDAVGQRHRAGRPAAAGRAGRGGGGAGAHAGQRAAARRGRARHRRRRGRAPDHGHPRRRAGGRRVPPGRRPAQGAVPAHADRRRALVARPRDRRRRGHDVGRVGGRPARRQRCLARGVVPGVARAVPIRAHGRVPAHHGPGQAGQHRGAVHGPPVRQRGQRLLRLRRRDDRRRARGRAGAGVAGGRRPLRAPLPARDGQAAARAALAVPAQRLPEARAHARGAGPRVRDRPGRAGGDGRAVQRGRPARRGPGLRPGLDPVQPLRRRPVGGPQPVARAAGEGPVLRGADRARQLRHVRGPGHRRPRPRAGRRRHPDPRPLRRRQRPGERDGRALPRGRDQHRPGDDVRLHRRPRPRRRRHAVRVGARAR